MAENKIFNTNRNSKEKKLENFINTIETLTNNIFKNIKENKGGNELLIKKETWDKYYEILTLLNYIIIDILDNVSKKSVDKYKNKEKVQYNRLVEYYNKIDINRKDINAITKKYNTLDRMKNIQDDKLNNIKNKNSNTFIVLVVMYILTFLLLIILIMIKYYK